MFTTSRRLSCLFFTSMCYVFCIQVFGVFNSVMSTQEAIRSHLQSQNQAKKLNSVPKSCVKQRGFKKTNSRSYSMDTEQSKPKLLTREVESVSIDETWAKNASKWKSPSRSRPAGVRTTRQIRRNERERGRKARLNAAFQVLRSVVPSTLNTPGAVSERKMTQVEILRLAKNYISNLTELLKEDNKYALRPFTG